MQNSTQNIQMTENLRLSVEQRPSTSNTHNSEPRKTMLQRKVSRNVQLLSVYLEPRLYEKGVKFIAQMNNYYLNRDPVRFKLYLDVYAKLVMDDDVAKFRAHKKIDKFYGDMIAQFQ